MTAPSELQRVIARKYLGRSLHVFLPLRFFQVCVTDRTFLLQKKFLTKKVLSRAEIIGKHCQKNGKKKLF